MEQTTEISLPSTATAEQGQPPQYGRPELINRRATGQFILAETLKAFVEQKVVYDKYFTHGHGAMLYFSHLRHDPNLNDPNLVGWTK